MGQGSSENSILGMARVLLPVIVGFILGFFSTLFRDWRKNKKNLENIRQVFFLELRRNYRLIIRNMPQGEEIGGKLVMPTLVGVMEDLPSSVYTTYLGRLADLPTEERDKLYNAYCDIEECIEKGRLAAGIIREGEAKIENIIEVLGYCEKALESIGVALLIFEGGAESLNSFKKQRGERVKLLLKQQV